MQLQKFLRSRSPGRATPRKTFATTVNYYPNHPLFAERAHILDVPLSLERYGRYSLLDEFRLLGRILRASLFYEVLLVFSHRGRLIPELLASVIFGFWPNPWRPAVVFYGEMYEPNSGLRHWVERLVMRLADRSIVRYVVYSKDERATFAQAWQVDPAKMRSVQHPFYGEWKLEQPPLGPTTEFYVFSGGNSFRDYRTLIEAARAMPEVPFVVCTDVLAADTPLPANVRVSSIPRGGFGKLLREAGAVVVPLERTHYRSAGILTYQQAMWLKKPTIVSDGLGVREYVEDGVTGWVVDGSPASYVQTLRWITDPNHQDQVAQVRKKAHEMIDLCFNSDNCVMQLLEIMEEVIAERAVKKGKARQQ